jgi:hypothetical protein
MNTMEQRESFFMRIMGDFYDVVSDFAIPIVRIGTPVFFVLLGLTFVCHWSFVCNLFSFASGFSILFIAYIISVIFVIDRLLLYRVFKQKSPEYSTTTIWGIALILAGIGACILTNNYKKHYRFECTEWYVDEPNCIYHWNNNCEKMSTSSYTAKGYEFRNKGLALCDYCKEEMEEYEPEPIRKP